MPGFIGWMLTPEFRRHPLTYIPLDTLLTTMSISKEFEETTREYIARRFEDGEMIFHLFPRALRGLVKMPSVAALI